MKNIFVALVLFIAAFSANAAIDCAVIPVRNLIVQGDRENNHPLENSFSITVAGIGTCSGIELAYMKNDDPAYSSMLSILLATQARGGEVKVVVSSSQGYSAGAKVIEYIELP